MLRTSFFSENVTRFGESVFWQLSNKLSPRFALGNYSKFVNNEHVFKASFDKKLMWHFSSVCVCVCVFVYVSAPITGNKQNDNFVVVTAAAASLHLHFDFLAHFNSAIPFAAACERIY